jgi:hypothetical protein
MQTTKADELYAGADLHGNNVFLSVCNHDEKRLWRGVLCLTETSNG